MRVVLAMLSLALAAVVSAMPLDFGLGRISSASKLSASAGSYTNVTASDLLAVYTASPQFTYILDVREGVSEYTPSHIPGAKNFPKGFVADHFREVPTDVDVYVHCKSGFRSTQVSEYLASVGFTNIFNVVDGFDAWKGPVKSLPSNSYFTMSITEAESSYRGVKLYDTRQPWVYDAGHIPGAINVDTMDDNLLNTIPFLRNVVIIGQNSSDGTFAAKDFVNKGRVGIYLVEAGMDEWTGPLEASAGFTGTVTNRPNLKPGHYCGGAAKKRVVPKTCTTPGCGYSTGAAAETPKPKIRCNKPGCAYFPEEQATAACNYPGCGYDVKPAAAKRVCNGPGCGYGL